ncbi:uncharacterized protein LOC119679784 [Teleopsis dalmanni]|uniref:uncharacterized protein LOC119679784 n=1 Tax=Teleopsis dalmanni TaxID=139649 RepID=UPI0018CFBB77|nr:uncharacterized protein LOC119679784 [Teleopsis dalmanni]
MKEVIDRFITLAKGQVDDRDRTIRLQRNLIEKLEAEKAAGPNAKTDITKECINTATQTERTRPLAIGTENLSSAFVYETLLPAFLDNKTLQPHTLHTSQNTRKSQYFCILRKTLNTSFRAISNVSTTSKYIFVVLFRAISPKLQRLVAFCFTRSWPSLQQLLQHANFVGQSMTNCRQFSRNILTQISHRFSNSLITFYNNLFTIQMSFIANRLTAQFFGMFHF